MTVGLQEVGKEPHCVGVRLHGALTLVLAMQGQPEAVVEGPEVQSGIRWGCHVNKLGCQQALCKP